MPETKKAEALRLAFKEYEERTQTFLGGCTQEAALLNISVATLSRLKNGRPVSLRTGREIVRILCNGDQNAEFRFLKILMAKSEKPAS